MSSHTVISFRPESVIRQIPWRLGSKTALGFLLILAIFSLVGWLYLTNASTVTATTYRLDELRIELDQIRNQNAKLILEIAQLQALSRVEARARELGFESTTQTQYISIANYPAPAEAELSDDNFTYFVENNVDAYIAEVEEPEWWVELLDTIAAWLESGEHEAAEFQE